MASSLNRVRYAGSDFDTHEDEILARLQVKFASIFNDFSVSSLGIMLVDIFSYGLDTLSFYLDRRASDNFLLTSRTRSSTNRLARQLGYRPGPASASSVDIEISLSGSYSFPVIVPVGFQFNGPNGLIFQGQESVTFSIGDTSTKTITASEGQTVVSTFFSNGAANQVFQISNVPNGKFIVGKGSTGQSQVLVTVDGKQWTEQDFLQFGDTEQFEIGYLDSPPTLRFGDGIAGAIPDLGAEIVIVYFASSGVNGTATANTITGERNPLVVSFTTVSLNVNNPEGTSGGSDPEPVSSIRANAPLAFKSRGVNVTLEDYQARAQAFVDPIYGSIAVARAINVKGSSDDAYLTSRLININSQSQSYEPTVDAALALIAANTLSISNSVSDAQTDDSSLQTFIADILTEENSARTSNESNRTAANVIQSNSIALNTDVSDITSAINSYTIAGTTQITTSDKNVLLNILSYITAKNSEINSQSSAVISNVTSITTSLDQIDTKANAAEVRRAGIRADINSISTQNGLISSTSTTLASDVEAIENDISTYTSQIQDHVDAFLSSECKSNLIEVPVLTFDSEGFYAVPTNGLQKSLQNYLDNAKEVTQVVKVVGNQLMLVPADIDITVGILNGYNESTVKSIVEAAILNVLRGRDFGEKLRLSELYAPTAPRVNDIPIDGVEYINIKIIGPAARIDADGELPVLENEVVTRGTITIASEIVKKSLVGQ